MKQKFKKCLAVLLILACTFSVNLNVFAGTNDAAEPAETTNGTLDPSTDGLAKDANLESPSQKKEDTIETKSSGTGTETQMVTTNETSVDSGTDKDKNEQLKVTYYTISFDPADGTLVDGTTPTLDAQKVASGDKAVAPSVTKGEDYNFDGWYYTDSDEKIQKWNFNDPVNSDLNLKAQYSSKETGEDAQALTEQTITAEFDGKSFSVSGKLPNKAQLRVSSVNVASAEETIENSLGDGNMIDACWAYDIKIMMADNTTEFQPENVGETVQVKITDVNVLEDTDTTTVFHIKDNESIEQIDASVTNVPTDVSSDDTLKSTIQFDTDSFSIFVGTLKAQNMPKSKISIPNHIDIPIDLLIDNGDGKTFINGPRYAAVGNSLYYKAMLDFSPIISIVSLFKESRGYISGDFQITMIGNDAVDFADGAGSDSTFTTYFQGSAASLFILDGSPIIDSNAKKVTFNIKVNPEVTKNGIDAEELINDLGGESGDGKDSLYAYCSAQNRYVANDQLKKIGYARVSASFSGNLTFSNKEGTQSYPINLTGVQSKDNQDPSVAKNSDGETYPVTATAFYKADDTSTTSVTWQVSKSKKATPVSLDSNNTVTKVTLSLPSAEEELTSDVVFVLDVSSCAEEVVSKKMPEMLDDLYSRINSTQAKLNVGIVMFRGNAKSIYDITKYNGDSTQITNAITEGLKEFSNKPYKGFNPEALHGSNIPAGLDEARIMLNGSSTPNNRKYMILISDGATYLYTHNNDPATCFSRTSGYASMGGGLYEYTAKYFPDDPNSSSLQLPAKFPGWAQFLSDIAKVRVSYAALYDAAYISKDSGLQFDPPKYTACTKENVGSFIINVEESLYQSYSDFKDIADSGVSCYAVKASNTDMGIFSSFMNYLATIGKGTSTDFSNIEDNILYLINSGTVTDVIGSNFDLVTDSIHNPFTLTCAGAVLPSVSTGDNEWSFGTPTSGVYPYVIKYMPGDKEQFIWTINIKVKNSEPLQLSYNLNLTTDISGIYPTNESATLAYTSSDGVKTGTEIFEVPTVTYTVSGGDNTQNGTGTSETTTTTAATAGAVLGASRQPAAIASTQTTPQGQVLGASRNSAVPKTSDDFPMTLLILMEVVGISGVTAMLLIRKKRNSK